LAGMRGALRSSNSPAGSAGTPGPGSSTERVQDPCRRLAKLVNMM